MPVQNEVVQNELLLIGAYFLQIGANITNRYTKHVYSDRVIFIEIEDHDYEFLNKQFLQYSEGQLTRTSLLLEVLEASTRIGTHCRCFLGGNLLGTISSPKVSRNFGGVTS